MSAENPLARRNIGKSLKSMNPNPVSFFRDLKTNLDVEIGREKSDKYFRIAAIASAISPIAAVIGVVIHEPLLFFSGTFFTTVEAASIASASVFGGKEVRDSAERIRKNPQLPGF